MKKRIKAKSKGLRREREARKIAESEGYYVCPSKGSLGPFDFSAIAKEFDIEPQVFCAEVKCNRISGKERKELQDFQITVEKQLWLKRDYKPWIRITWNEWMNKWAPIER